MTSPQYVTNFHKGKYGNSLHFGEDLKITINGKPIFITGQLFKQSRFGRMKMIQIEQTGTKNNPSKDTIKFEMKHYVSGNVEFLPKGKYMVKTTTERNGWKDKFEIE